MKQSTSPESQSLATGIPAYSGANSAPIRQPHSVSIVLSGLIAAVLVALGIGLANAGPTLAARAVARPQAAPPATSFGVLPADLVGLAAADAPTATVAFLSPAEGAVLTSQLSSLLVSGLAESPSPTATIERVQVRFFTGFVSMLSGALTITGPAGGTGAIGEWEDANLSAPGSTTTSWAITGPLPLTDRLTFTVAARVVLSVPNAPPVVQVVKELVTDTTMALRHYAVDTVGPSIVLTAPKPLVPAFQVLAEVLDGSGPGPLALSFTVGTAPGAGALWLTASTPLTATFGPTAPVAVAGGQTYVLIGTATDPVGNASPAVRLTVTVPPAQVAVPQAVRIYDMMIGPTPGPTATPTPQPVKNGTFAEGLTGWTALDDGLGAPRVISTSPLSGTAVLLGNPDWGCRSVPQDRMSQIAQFVQVPDRDGVTLKFDWLMRTRDFKTTLSGRLVDSLDVYVIESPGVPATPRNGNADRRLGREPNAPELRCEDPESTVSGTESIDLNSKRGRGVWIFFQQWNRVDSNLNSYSYLDNIRIE